MVKTGAMKSKFPIKIANSAINNDTKIALTGSFLELTFWNLSRNGINESLAIACNNLGAPTNDCNEAPNVESRAPSNMMVGCGHAINVTANLPPKRQSNQI